jgi:hypothetical protein
MGGYPPAVAGCCCAAVEAVVAVLVELGVAAAVLGVAAVVLGVAAVVVGVAAVVLGVAAVVLGVAAAAVEDVELVALELDWSGGLATTDPVVFDMMLELVTAPFAAVDARNVAGSGAWMFASAC